MPHSSARLQAKVGMARPVGGPLLSLGLMTLSLCAGLACPGNLDTAFLQSDFGGPGGTAGTGSGGSGAIPASCAVEPTILLQAKCGTAFCHTPGNITAAGLDLVSADFIDHLLGGVSDGDPYSGAQCAAGMTYLNPGSNPATGLFIDKLTYPTCGSAMPPSGTWSAAQNQCILDWATSITAP